MTTVGSPVVGRDLALDGLLVYDPLEFIEQVGRFGTAFDYNGDGRSDLIVKVASDRWVVLLSLGTSFTVVALPDEFDLSTGNHLVVYDDDHDGLRDIRQIGRVWRRQGASRHRLHAVTNGLGARTEVRYAELGQGQDELEDPLGLPIYFHAALSEDQLCRGYPCYERRPSGAVVRRVRYWDRLWTGMEEPTRSFAYGYRVGRYDLQGRGFLGFAARSIVDEQRHALAQAAGGRHLINLLYDNTTYDASSGLYPFAGRVKQRIEIVHAADRYRQQVTTRTQGFVKPTPRSLFAYSDSEHATVVESDSESPPNSELLLDVNRSWTYDNYGNVELFTQSHASGEQTSVDTDYVSDDEHVEGRWLIGLPQRQVRRSERGGLTATQTAEFAYAEDDPATASDHVAYTGLPVTLTLEPEDGDQELTTRYAYSAAGNVEEFVEEGATVDLTQTRRTAIDYDDFDLFPVSLTTPDGYETQLYYDRALGALKGTTRPGPLPDTGVKVGQWSVPDGFGRPRHLHASDETLTVVDYLESTNGGLAIRTTPPGGPTETVRYDVLGREVERELDGFDAGTTLRVGTQYNELGLVKNVSRAHKSSAPDPDLTEFTYDAMGRPLVVTLPNDETVEHCYLNSAACVTNPRGFTSCRVYDRYGQLAYRVDPNDDDQGMACEVVAEQVAAEFPQAGDPLPGTALSASRYVYGPFGAVRSLVDPAGNATVYDRDDYLRVRQSDDPNAGIHRYTYNAFGELETTADARGQRAVYRYDLLGRPTSRTELHPGEPDEGTGEVAQWLWDYAYGSGFYGRLAGTLNHNGITTTVSYDDFGRLEDLYRVVPGDDGNETMVRHQSYEASTGRLSMVMYESSVDPGAPFRIRYGYNERGYLDRVSRPDPDSPGDPGADTDFWRAVSTDHYGQLEVETFGQGSDQLTTWRTYHPGTGQLATLGTQRPGGGDVVVLQNRSYTYDANGNVATRSDAMTLEYTQYEYDALDRLGSASTAIIVGDPYVESYLYDPVGNIVTTGVTDPGAAQTVTRDYDYGGVTGGPHAVNQVTQGTGETECGFGESECYFYDANGNLDHRAGSLQSGLTIHYNRQGRPYHVDVSGFTTEVFLDYDVDGTRVRKSGTTSQTPETFYLDDAYSRMHLSGSSGFVERVVVMAGGRQVAEVLREPDGTEATRYLHEDRLGSIETISEPAGPELVPERRTYQAFGKRRNVAGEVPFGTRGDFTGHELDAEIGLINMKARLYDPEIGRFIMPDPIIAEPGWSQGLNAYSYVNNNPVNWVDPLGLQRDCGPDGDDCPENWFEGLIDWACFWCEDEPARAEIRQGGWTNGQTQVVVTGLGGGEGANPPPVPRASPIAEWGGAEGSQTQFVSHEPSTSVGPSGGQAPSRGLDMSQRVRQEHHGPLDVAQWIQESRDNTGTIDSDEAELLKQLAELIAWVAGGVEGQEARSSLKGASPGRDVTTAARAGAFGAQQAIEQGLVRQGGKLAQVLEGAEAGFARAGPKSATEALSVIKEATARVGLEPGVASVSKSGEIILQNVGNVTTTLGTNGSILIQRGTDVLLRLVP